MGETPVTIHTADGAAHLVSGPATMRGRHVDLSDLPDVTFSHDALVVVANHAGSLLVATVHRRMEGLNVPVITKIRRAPRG